MWWPLAVARSRVRAFWDVGTCAWARARLASWFSALPMRDIPWRKTMRALMTKVTFKAKTNLPSLLHTHPFHGVSLSLSLSPSLLHSHSLYLMSPLFSYSTVVFSTQLCVPSLLSCSLSHSLPHSHSFGRNWCAQCEFLGIVRLDWVCDTDNSCCFCGHQKRRRRRFQGKQKSPKKRWSLSQVFQVKLIGSGFVTFFRSRPKSFSSWLWLQASLNKKVTQDLTGGNKIWKSDRKWPTWLFELQDQIRQNLVIILIQGSVSSLFFMFMKIYFINDRLFLGGRPWK